MPNRAAQAGDARCAWGGGVGRRFGHRMTARTRQVIYVDPARTASVRATLGRPGVARPRPAVARTAQASEQLWRSVEIYRLGASSGFQVMDGQLVVLVVGVGHRREIYRDQP